MILAALAALFLGLAALAHADGDPASDVLATQRSFIPQDAGVPAKQQAELAALLDQAARRGYPLRLAIVASPSDLGSIGQLWRQPRAYAHFLGQELSLIARGPLLIVMPNGYGTYVPGRLFNARGSDLTRLPAPGSGLGTAAVTAITRLAADSGHPVTATPGPATSASHSTNIVPILVFVFGAALIAAAWTISLRLRPLRPGR